jgi:hypothetical protein
VVSIGLGEFRDPPSVKSFFRYVRARGTREQERFAFRAYVCECLRLQPQGKCLQRSWVDVVRPGPTEAAEDVVESLERAGAFRVVG